MALFYLVKPPVALYSIFYGGKKIYSSRPFGFGFNW